MLKRLMLTLVLFTGIAFSQASPVSGGSTSSVTTKGDLQGYNSSAARVPVGTDGQCLKADSSNALGVSYAACAGAATGYQTIQNATVAITQRTVLNWLHSITCVDNAGSTRSDCDITDKTGSGTTVVMNSSPTIVTPTIASFVNATHDHSNAAGGGNIAISTGISGLGSGVATFLATPSSANFFSALTDEIGSGSKVAKFTAVSGNSGTAAQTSGTLTSGNCAKFDANGNIVDAATTCGGGGGGGITNSAGNNVIPKSDGTNIVASSLSDNGTTVSTAEAFSAASYTSTGGGADTWTSGVSDPACSNAFAFWPSTTTANRFKYCDANSNIRTIMNTADTLLSAQMPTFTGDVTNSGLAMTVAKIQTTAVSGTTGTTNVVFSGSPTIVTPTIASFVNATHNHTNAAGGGTLTLAGAAFANQGTTSTLYHGNASGNGSFGAVALATEVSGTLPIGNGGTGTASTLTGLVRGSGSAMTAAELSGAATTSGSNVVTLAAKYVTMTCEGGLGDGLNAIPAGTYLQTICRNETGATLTITAVRCYSDNNGTSTCNVTDNSATALLTGAVTATNSYANGTQSGTTTLAASGFFKMTFVADGTSKQISMVLVTTR